MLSTETRVILSGVLLATERGHNARALPVRELVKLAGSMPSDRALSIDFAFGEQLGQPLIVLGVLGVRRSLRFDALTPREREVAAFVAAGLPNREIASRLWLTTATVKDHVHRILAKTGLPNRTAVAAAWNVESSFRQPSASTTLV